MSVVSSLWFAVLYISLSQSFCLMLGLCQYKTCLNLAVVSAKHCLVSKALL